MQTLSTTTFVLKALLEEIKKQYPEFNIKYSQNFDYVASEQADRANTPDSVNQLDSGSLPVLFFNRSSLRPTTTIGSRGNRFSAYENNPGNVKSDIIKFRTAHLEFDFNFSLVDKDVATIENFEVDYLSKEGLGRITEFEADFNSTAVEVGSLKYYVEWPASLSNFMTNINQNSYVSIDGTAKVRGYFVSLYGETPIIKNIKMSLDRKYNNLIEQVTIP